MGEIVFVCFITWDGEEKMDNERSKTFNHFELTGVEACILQLFQPLLPQLFPFALTMHLALYCSKQKQQ